MDFLELVKESRSCRGYYHSRKVTKEQLEQLVNLARFCPSTVNRQPVKFFISYDEKTTAEIQKLTSWAGMLKDKITLPLEGEEPSAFIVVCVDTDIMAAQAAEKDVGITSQTILLGAKAMGLGGCMIGSFKKPQLREVLHLPEKIEPSLVLAIGSPKEKIVLTDVGEDGSTAYYRDEDNVHYVPKRTLDELIINR